MFSQSVSWQAYDKYITRLFGHSRDSLPSFNGMRGPQLIEANLTDRTGLLTAQSRWNISGIALQRVPWRATKDLLAECIFSVAKRD